VRKKEISLRNDGTAPLCALEATLSTTNDVLLFTV